MRLTTLKGRPQAERIMERRERWFAGIDRLTDAEIEQVGERWHALANRYQKMVARILTRTAEEVN